MSQAIVKWKPQLNTVHNWDAIQLSAHMPDESVDMILCDLPYGTTACAWDTIIPLEPLWREWRRIIKPRGAIVCTASQPFTTTLINAAFDLFKYSWVWSKNTVTDVFNAPNKPLKEHEDILVFSKGTTANGSNRKMNYYPQGVMPNSQKLKIKNKHYRSFGSPRPSHVDVYEFKSNNYPRSIINIPNRSRSKVGHPTEKPIALFEYLILTYTVAGDLVFDPTAGSGTTAMAARKLNRNYIVSDNGHDERTGKAWADLMRERLEKPYTPNMFEHIS